MQLLALLSGLLCFTIVLALLYPVGYRMDIKRRRLESINKKTNDNIDDELKKPFYERFILPIVDGGVKYISKMYPKSKKGDSRKKLEKDLKLAGIKINPGEFSAIKLVVMISCMGLALLPMFSGNIPAAGKLLILLAGVISAVLIPRYYLQSKIKSRQQNIRNELPDILDLLSVSVEAGLGFDNAIIKVTSKSRGFLTEELKTVYREIQMGRTRRQALKEMSERSTVEELKIFVSSIIQADQLGISIKNVLRTQSAQLRRNRKQKAEEKAMKAPVKMMIPLVVFIFPVIFIILMGPAVIDMISTFGGQ